MKSFFIALVMSVVWAAACAISIADEPDWQYAKPSDARSYTGGFSPYLGGAYRNPDAYLPYYPGYAPYWQQAPVYPYAPATFFYPYQYYPLPVYTPADRLYGPRAVQRFMGTKPGHPAAK